MRVIFQYGVIILPAVKDTNDRDLFISGIFALHVKRDHHPPFCNG